VISETTINHMSFSAKYKNLLQITVSPKYTHTHQ
jgi:hypothetical protein